MDAIGGRFAIERDAGAGGMARVYRARDLSTDRVVALKLLTRMEESDLKRFTREVAALSELRDPAIPQYVAHGFTPAGEPWLAMEWLDGESLDGYLARGPLSVEQTLALARAVAGGLAAAHARGLIHRDVKPGNVFLVASDPARAKLIDFGIARDTVATSALTSSGDLLGTPLYMAPEQARGELDLDARVDVYALGALLYVCLVGRPPFLASTLVALLAKIVVEEAPSLAAHAPDIPPALDALVACMLAKHRDERPADARAVGAQLASLGDDIVPVRRAALRSGREQRVVSILLASGVRIDGADVTIDATIAAGGGALALADGSALVTFSGPESPSDLAARAVRYAIGVHSPGSAIALATGRAVLSGGTPVGEVIERAGRQLALATGVVRIDEDTAGLVEGRFELAHDAFGAKVLSERDDRDAIRTLLGKPTRVFGRDRELAELEGHYSEVVCESIARVVLAFAEPGVGKSRFAREVVRRLTSRDDAPFVLYVRGEPSSATIALSAIASALREAQPANTDVDEFLAELVGIPMEQTSEALRAARESPQLMFDQLRAAWTRWLRAACARGPVFIIVEDLQWVDAQSLLLLDAALGALADQPLLIAGVGRPEARKAGLPFAAHKPHELRLDPLPRRASERLVREALGADVSNTIVEKIVARAEGNALFLEELVRAFSQSMTALPVGVIGTVQLRLDALRPDARAVLGAASVFGERFDATAVAVLVGRDAGAALDELVAHELIANTGDAYAFRHDLVREVAYALLTEEDRLLAHGLAAELLEREGEQPPETIAHHYQLAKRREEAATWFARAGERALLHNDLTGAITLARRALAWTERAHVRGHAEHVIAEAEMWRANLPAARTAGTQAVEHLSPDTVEWFEAAALLITIAGQLGDNDAVVTWVERAMAHEPEGAAVSPFANCLARAASQLFLADRGEVALRALDRLDAIDDVRELSPHARARVAIARGYRHVYRGAMDTCVDYLADAVGIYEHVGAQRDALQAGVMRGTILAFSGAVEEARTVLERVETEATRIAADFIAQWARWNLGLVSFASGQSERARDYIDTDSRAPKSPLFVGGTTVVCAWFAFQAGDLDTVDAHLARVEGMVFHDRYRAVIDIYRARRRQLRGEHDDAIIASVRSALDVIDRPTLRCDVHLAGISIGLEVLLAAGVGDTRDLVAYHQRRVHETAATFAKAENGARFLRLPWLRHLAKL